MNILENSTTHIFYSASNTLSPNQSANAGWLKLVQYGTYPHEKGIQIFTTKSAQLLVNNFKSLKSRLARAFGGVPIFVGHPDDPSFAEKSGHQDTRAYGWITDMRNDTQGLWVLPKWSKIGKEILENAFYKFLSPRWMMHQREDDAFEPIELISVGLTNAPNIPGEVIANAITEASIPFDESDCSENSTTNKTTAKDLEELIKTYDAQNQALKEEKQSLEAILSNAQAELMREKQEKITFLLKLKVKEGCIPEDQQPYWSNALNDNFEEAFQKLSVESSCLNTHSKTSELGKYAYAANSSQGLNELLKQRMATTGEGYQAAWRSLKRLHREYFL